jgi:hypothetical protein
MPDLLAHNPATWLQNTAASHEIYGELVQPTPDYFPGIPFDIHYPGGYVGDKPVATGVVVRLVVQSGYSVTVADVTDLFRNWFAGLDLSAWQLAVPSNDEQSYRLPKPEIGNRFRGRLLPAIDAPPIRLPPEE